jgi:hypothetical protein
VNASCMALAWATGHTGDLNGACQRAERAIEERDMPVGSVHIDALLLAPELASDPRYDAVLARLDLLDVAR